MMVWLWLKKNWKWLLFPIGILVWLAGRASRPTIKVASPELVEHFEKRVQLDAEAEQKKEQAVIVRDEMLKGIEEHHTKSVQAVTVESEKQASRLRSDDKALNDFLKRVGKDVRSKPKS